ncbi:cilia- and flagella-associated protein 58 isoform X2 [Ictalurus furcatus]|uniref:cilia- and flagella-associated protein 58 isoform X1 n=1 Tax=Ictalurus furcatus TaxID=66913 RepID=UPI0023501DAE|nr:cilia- and flagella-associated protein 58 isoform X1 [Ictalurus furcatus]XP_053471026.1 cilia- and flagella-associated protein 58 isoform X2 [Ictalurus furcatus]
MEEKAQKPAVEENSFEAFEKEFQDVLNELAGENSLDLKFRAEHEKLITALKNSHENENRLMTKCRELKAEIRANAVKVEAALKLSHEDQATIMPLKKEIEKAWEMVDAAHEKEKIAKDTIKTLQQEINRLTVLVEQEVVVSKAEVQSVGELLKIKEQLTAERDKLLSELVTLRDNFEKATIKQHEAEEANMKTQETILQLEQDIQVRQNECSRETRQKETLEKELKQLRADVEAQQLEMKAIIAQSQHSKDNQKKMEQQLYEQKILNERVSKELEQLQVRKTKLQQENDQNTLRLEQLTYENNQQASELKMVREEVSQMKQETVKLTKIREATQKKLRLMEVQKLEVEEQRDTLKNQIGGLEKEMEMAEKQTESDKKKIDELIREKDMLSKNMIKAANATEKQLNLVKLHEQTKKTLDQEILNYRDEAQKQRKIIFQLEKERDRYINEASDLTQKVLSNMEDLKVREMEIFEYKKKIAEAETKLKQQQNLYEAIRAERNNYSKNLRDTQHEITDIKHKLKSMTQENGQLTEEIKSKEAALVKEHLEFQRIEKEKKALKAELQKMKQQAQETKQYMDNQEVEEQKLQKIIADADAEKVSLKKELDQVSSERDILGTQLVRRNDELALLYEKIKIQQSIMNKGEIQYNQRVEDIRLLKLEIRKLRSEKSVLNKTVSNVEDLRREVFHMQKDLLKERARCQSLQEKLENPINVHRWRRLEANDPSTFELIQKIHSLQRHLIKKSKEVVEKELLLQEKEKLYVELKHILARQPGPEAAEQLLIYQQTLKKKTRQLKTVTAELNMFESHAKQYKNEIEQLTSELHDMKKKYLMQKRKEQACRENERSLEQAGQPLIMPQRIEGPRFTGGGFSLKQGKKIAARTP